MSKESFRRNHIHGGDGVSSKAESDDYSVQEVALVREDHRHSVSVSGLDDLLIANASAGLYDGGHSGLGSALDAVREGEEGVRRKHAAGGTVARLEAGEIHA